MSNPTTYEIDGRIATIAIDDGKVNAFSIETLTAMNEALDRAEADGAVVVLTGQKGTSRPVSSCGVLLGDGGAVVEMLRLEVTLAERVLSFPTPVFGGVQWTRDRRGQLVGTSGRREDRHRRAAVGSG